MASVSFSRTSASSIYYSLSGAYSSSSYTYAVQVQSNSSGNWITKTYASVSSSGRATGTISVDNNVGYYCRVVEYYNDSVSAYIPYTAGSYVGSYSPPTPSYDGFIASYTIDGYTGSSSKPYQGEVTLRITISEGATTGWTIRVLNPDTGNAPTKVTLSDSGYYSFYLDSLYDGDTAQNYTIYLYDPDGVQQDYRYIRHLDTPTVTHTLFYLANGGTGAPNSQTVTAPAYDDPHLFTVSYFAPTRSGYQFLGWSKSSSATSATYEGGDGIYVSGQTTLYAVWEQVYTHTLFYNSDGADQSFPDQSAQSASASYLFTIYSTTPTKSGYTFKYWQDSSGGTHNPGSRISVSEYETLTAIWEKTAAAKVPNITSLVISNVSASGFTVSAAQDNLEAGYWRIEISADSGFNSILNSTQVIWSTRSLTYDFTGLSTNTKYYIRIRNYYDGDIRYATGWSQYTGIVPFAWTSNDAAQVVAGAEFGDVITASAWNTLGDKISAVSRRSGAGSVTLATVYSGTTALTAAMFNDARNAIAGLSGAGSAPEIVDTGDPVLSAQFANAAASLKSAINRAISALNN